MAHLSTAREASAYHDGDERIVDDTAHTLRARETRVGLWSIDFAPFSPVMVGTDPLPWAASFLVDSVVANGHLKLRVLRTTPLTVSLLAGAYHANINTQRRKDTGTGSLWLVPVTLFLSTDLTRRASLHLGVTYAYGDLSGDVDRQLYRTGAQITASAIQIHGMAEYRLTRAVAFALETHAQAYASPIAVRTRTSSAAAAGTTLDFSGTVEPVQRTAVVATAAIALSGKNVNARFGAGYGAIFLPSMGFMIPITTVVPEVDFHVRF